MDKNHGQGDDSSPHRIDQQNLTPLLSKPPDTERNTLKRPRSTYTPPSIPRNGPIRHETVNQQQTTSGQTIDTIAFPPIIVRFKNEQSMTIKDVTDDLISQWKSKHGMNLQITARYGYQNSLLVFANHPSTFELMLESTRWPHRLVNTDIDIQLPKQLPADYSLVIQRFDRTWNEEEWLVDLKDRYVSLYKITRLRVRDGSPLNSVRADFRSIEEVRTILQSGQINVGSMRNPVKPYHAPIRINKCMRCLRHDHSTKECSLPRVCPRCAQQHQLLNGCPNEERCANCGGKHMSGHASCPVVQEKRRALAEIAKQHRAELLIEVERDQHRPTSYDRDFPSQANNNGLMFNHQTSKTTQSYAQVVARSQLASTSTVDLQHALKQIAARLESRLDEISSLLASHKNETQKILEDQNRKFEVFENVMGTVVLPCLQQLALITGRSTRDKTKKAELKRHIHDLNQILANKAATNQSNQHQNTTNVNYESSDHE